MTPRWPARLLPLAAGLLAVWSLAPLAIWWDGTAPSYFTGAWTIWVQGSVVAALAVALLLAVTRGRAAAWLLIAWRRLLAVPAPVFVGGAALVFASLAVLCTLMVFDGNPRNVDGFAQLFQARIFLAGHVWVPVPAELGNFATLQMILGPDRWYSQYPPGQSAVLAVALLVGAWWLLNPLIAAALVVATWRVARWCADEGTARIVLLLLCVSTFAVAVAGSEMNHLTAATLGMAAAAFATMVSDRRSVLWPLASGLALGLMTSFRPLDAVAAAVVVGVILGGWAQRRILALALTAVGGVAGSIPVLWYNSRTTGSPLVFGYTALWGPQHSLGFHPVPFGIPLTLTRAIARSGLDLHQLNMYLIDSTLPVLLIVAAGYIAGRRALQSRDAVPFAGVLSLVGLLFFYWHRDVFYGPRFLYSAAAWFVILLGRALVLMRRAGTVREDGSGWGLTAAFATLIAVLVGLVALTPTRLDAYRRSTPIFSLHPDRDAIRANLPRSVVFIPDGWGSRLIARMWQLGVPVRRSSRLYAAIDACTLDEALARAERDSSAHWRLRETLDSLALLGRPGVPAGRTADANLRLPPPASRLPEACLAELDVDRRGYYSYSPYLWLNPPSLDGPIVWARDLGPGNADLVRRYAGRRFYRYVPGPDGQPTFLPVQGPGW